MLSPKSGYPLCFTRLIGKASSYFQQHLSSHVLLKNRPIQVTQLIETDPVCMAHSFTLNVTAFELNFLEFALALRWPVFSNWSIVSPFCLLNSPCLGLAYASTNLRPPFVSTEKARQSEGTVLSSKGFPSAPAHQKAAPNSASARFNDSTILVNPTNTWILQMGQQQPNWERPQIRWFYIHVSVHGFLPRVCLAAFQDLE